MHSDAVCFAQGAPGSYDTTINTIYNYGLSFAAAAPGRDDCGSVAAL